MKKPEYIKMTLLDDFMVGISIGRAKDSTFWRVVQATKSGLVIENGHIRAILSYDELKAGERHLEPNFSLPLGLHIKLERGYYRTWYGKYMLSQSSKEKK